VVFSKINRTNLGRKKWFWRRDFTAVIHSLLWY